MLNISTSLPQGPSIQAPATTNLGFSGLAGSRPNITPNVSNGQNVGSMLSALGGSVLPGAIGSAVGVIGNLIGDAINYKRQKEMYGLQRADALEDYATQRKDYLSDLASERLYNSPLAQVQRLKAAGINPNVAFGSGSPSNTTETAQNGASIRSAGVPNIAGSPLGDAAIRGATGLIQSSLTGVQSQQMIQDIALKKAEAIKVLSDAKFTYSKDVRQKIENSFLDSMFTADLAEKQARTNQLIDSLETAALGRLSATYDLYHLKPAQKAQIEAAIAQYYSNVRSINQQNAYFDSVKNVRQRNEIIDMKRNSYQMAEDHFRRDIFKVLQDRGQASTMVGQFVHDSAFLLKYLWNFK